MKKIKFNLLYHCQWMKKADRRIWFGFFIAPSLYFYRQAMPVLAHDGNGEQDGTHFVYGLTLVWMFFSLSIFKLEFIRQDKPDDDTDADNVQGPIVFHEEEC